MAINYSKAYYKITFLLNITKELTQFLHNIVYFWLEYGYGVFNWGLSLL